MIPRLEAPVKIQHLAGQTSGVINQVDADLRHLQVLTEDGETVSFELDRVTGHFTSGGQSGLRLLIGGEQGDR